MLRCKICVLFALAAHCVNISCAIAEPDHAELEEQRHCFRAGDDETRLLPLKAGNNRFYKGKISTQEGRYSLDLVDKDGAHIRRLFLSQSGKNSFFFAADNTNQLKFTSEISARYCLDIDHPILNGEKNAKMATVDFLSPTLQQLANKGYQQRQVENFWQDVIKGGTPFIENFNENERIITFLQRGAKNNVRLFGAPSGDHENLVRFGKTDIWYKSYKVPADTRLTYQLAADVPDIAGNFQEKRSAIRYTAKADPFNRKPCPNDAPDAYSQDSTVELDKAPEQVFVQNLVPPQGKIENFDFFSKKLNNSHLITLYRTEGPNRNNANPILLFMFDGAEYQTKVPLPAILDKMVQEQAIAPVIAVFVHNIDRNSRARELPGNPDFADFMAEELLPEIEKRTGQTFSARRTVLAGSSFGGLAAMTVALRHAERFGNVISMSGSFWWSPEGTPIEKSEYVSYSLANMEKPPLHIFLSAGLFEGGHSGGSVSLLDANRHLRDVLSAKSVAATYREYSAGHDYAVWQGVISDGLIDLFPKE